MALEAAYWIWLSFILLLIAARVAWWALGRISWRQQKNRCRWAGRPLPLQSLVVLGSGGHTMEMLSLLRDIDQSRYQCDFVMGETDSTSLKKVAATRPDLAKNPSRFHTIPRSREVGQSWASTVPSTCKALIACLSLVWRLQPQVLIVNGPGTCVPVVAVALLLEIFAFRSFSLIFVESVCRVKSLSMSGKLAYLFSDVFVVHWPELAERYPKAQYLGVLL
mmetsp:Transcript_18694/g.35070  ORF Transcript_18694/g.35070 Transcript_18694/m.35070 type:complete len:221 (-) Transcript_18694:54-716(-)